MIGLRKKASKAVGAALALIPGGNAGLAVKVALGVAFAFWWTSGPGAEEESDHKAQQEPDRRSQYTRHYAFKGRGRKEFLRSDMKDDVNELVFTRSAAGVKQALQL
ncbi:hypothetical protein HYH03_017194 [Edaphochlamys debaryana]|uniref:Uncharacterized protein n=1 Tax=Edaphochlamys debaryana TaxID=47281 RepID=A0A835XH26_9CHLO|nr:hypothetical protein HYH03_017189 [Edaphochlamys debaryana]KAG2483948.1 hypothetical protein HYH03_017194 [Edaphochlamys debaryana]|eukprot:KAG2483943.1 hypothetical protein HYH03_017189 [Edaphochlamys debaryana]